MDNDGPSACLYETHRMTDTERHVTKNFNYFIILDKFVMRNFIFICIIFLEFEIKFYKIADKMAKKKKLNKSNSIDQIIFIIIHINYYTIKCFSMNVT